MISKNILLSISILISNRPDTVGKCLKSLDSLRSRVPSELILVDTGCGERVRQIIEPYADKIVDFEWCNDFSKARNAGLGQACGEWFLYLDDDEWFEDTEEIEDFFLSGQHLQYNYGFYLVRNYRDPEGRGYSDDYVGRLIRLFPDVQFMFSVHECFSNVRMPLIRLNSYVHHYGYVYENEEALKRHGRRNIELLLSEHEKEPSEMHHILQLTQEYNALKEWEKVIGIAREGIQNAKPGPNGDCYRGGFYGALIRALVALKQYDQAVETGEKYLGMEEPDELARACVYYFLCIAYLEMGESRKSLEAVQQYKNIYIKWRRNKDPFLRYETLLTDETFADESVRQVMYRGVRCGIHLGNAGLAKHYFDEINWNISAGSVDLAVMDLVQDLVKTWLQTGGDGAQEYTAMMRKLLEDGTLSRVVVAEINLRNQKSPESLRTQKADWASLADKNWIFLYFKIKNTPDIERSKLMEDYRLLWKTPQECLLRAKELQLWEIARRDDIPMTQILSDVPVQRWKQAAEAAVEGLDWQDIQEIQAHLHGLLGADSFHMMYWDIPYRLRRICAMAGDRDEAKIDVVVSPEDIVQELSEYAVESQKLYRRLYREELFRESPELLPQQCQLSLKLLEMYDFVEEGNLQGALGAVREALEIMPELSGVLKCCTEWLSEKSAAKNAEQEKVRSEMEQLARAVKAQVRNMVSRGMLAEAEGTLLQLKTLVPQDEEIPEMEKEIWRIRQGI